MPNIRKILTFFTLFFVLLSNLQIGVLYADEISKIKQEKEKSVAHLEKVEKVLNKLVVKIENKVKDKKQKDRIDEKQEEIKKYLEKAKQEISNENSKSDIKEITKKAKKVVVLKVVSGMTKQENIEKYLDKTINKSEALKAISKSIKSGEDYNLIIRTKYSKQKTISLFSKFDKDIKLNFLYTGDNNKNYFDVFIPKTSLFAQEMLSDLDNFVIPKNFLAIEIIKPEVFSITSPQPSPGGEGVSLSGEDLTKTWGIQKFNLNSYLSKLKEKNSQQGGFSPLKVGIIDTGIDYNHPELKGRVSHGKDFVNKDDDAWDDQGHGTHVAGTIGAGINGKGIIGVNPYVEFVPLKICNKRGFCPSYAVIKALDYAKSQKLDVVNMSLGGRGNPNTNAICSGIKELDKVGTIVVAASGNSNINTSNFVPGGCREAITVAAVDKELYRASFSNYGEKVDVSAPGVGIYSTLPNNRYRKLSGTSMATPHIVGLISVMKSFDKTLNSKKVKKLFKQNSITASYENGKYIAGFPDVEKIIKELQKNNTSTTLAKPLSGILTSSQEQGATKLVQTGSLKSNEAEIDSSLRFEEEDNSFNLEKLKPLKINSNIIDLGNTGTGVKINNLENFDESKIISENVDLKEEENKNYGEVNKDQYFNENGKISDNNVKINSLEENDNDEYIEGKYIEKDDIIKLDDEKQPEIFRKKEINQEELKEENNEKIEYKEEKSLYIDGAKPGVEINSVEKKEYKEIKIENYSTLDIEEENINFVPEKKQKVENLKELKHTEEVIIDGAKKSSGVEINSLNNQEKEINFLTEKDLEKLKKEENLIKTESGIIDFNKLEIKEILPEKENFKEEEIKDEYYIDGAKKTSGVKINSFSNEEPKEKVEVPVFDEKYVGNFEPILEKENYIEELGKEEIKKLEEEYKNIDKKGEEKEVKTEKFDNEILKKAQEFANRGVKINSLNNEVDFPEIKLTEKEKQELEEKYKNIDKDKKEEIKNIKIISKEELEQIKKQEEQNSGVQINSLEEEEKIPEIELTKEEKQELEKLDKNNKLKENEEVEIKADKLEKIEINKKEINLGKIEGVELEDGVEINSIGEEKIEEKIETEEDLKKVITNDIVLNKLKYQDEEQELKEDDKYKNLKDGEIIFSNTQTGNIEKNEEEGIGIQGRYYYTTLNCNIYIGGMCKYGMRQPRRYNRTQTNPGIANIGYDRGYSYIYGKKSGKSIVKLVFWRYIYTIYVNVKPLPEKFFQKEVTLQNGKNLKLNLEGAEEFTYSYSRGGIISVNRGSNYLNLKGVGIGNTYIYIRHKGQYIGRIKVKVTIKIINKTIRIGDTYTQRLRRARRYRYSVSDSSLASVSASRRQYYVHTKKSGTVDILVKDHRYRPLYILRLKITPLPVIEVNIPLGHSYHKNLIWARRLYNYEISDSSLVYISTNRYSYYVNTKKIGTVYIKVKSNRKNKYLYTLKVNITPPPIYEKELYIGQKYSKSLRRANRKYKFELSDNSLAELKASRGGYSIYPKKEGTLFVNVKNSGGITIYILKIKIKEPPKPKVYDLKVKYKSRTNINFPTKSNYKVYYSDGYKRRIWLRNYDGLLRVYGYSPGKVTYKVVGDGYLKYILNFEVVPDVREYNYTAYEGRYFGFRIWRWTGNLSSNSGKLLIANRSIRSYVRIWLKEPGTQEIYVKKNGYIIQKYIIKVLPVPKVKEYNATVLEKNITKIYLPENGNYYFRYVSENEGKISASQNGNNEVNISGINYGTATLYIYEKSNNFLLYKVHLKINPEPPKTIEKEVYETKTINLGNYSNYKISVSQTGVVDYSSNRNNLYIKGKKAGNLELYIKDKNEILRYIYKIKVKAKPELKTYNINMSVWGRKKIYLPEELNKYNLSSDAEHTFFRYNKLKVNKNEIYLESNRIGKATLYFKERDGYKWTRYIVNINIHPIYYDITLHQTDCKRYRDNDRYGYSQTNYDIAYMTRKIDRKGRKQNCIYGRNLGEIRIKQYYRTRHGRYLFGEYRIKVIPKPKPKELECNITVGNKCYFYLHNRGYSYNLSRSGVIRLRVKKTNFKVYGEKSGAAKIYVKSTIGNYYSHLLKIKVLAKPPRIYKVTLPVGISAISKWQEKYDRTHKFTTTDKTKVKLEFQKVQYKGMYSTSYSRVKFTALEEGKTKIYIYKDGDIIGIIEITIIPKLKGIKLDKKETYFKLKEGKRLKLKITEGVSKYKLTDYKKEILEASVNSKGEIEIKGKKEGVSWLRIVDKYNQYLDLKIKVKKSELSVSTSDRKLKLNIGEKYLVAIYDYYGTILLKRENTNISLRFKKGDNGTDYIEVTVLKKGESVFEIRDSKSVKGITIVVNKGVENGGEKKEEEKEDGKIEKIEYLQKIGEEGSNTIVFTTKGNSKEVGIEWEEEGELYKQILEKNKVGYYVLTCGVKCPENSRPYIIKENNEISYKNNLYYTFNGNNVTIASNGIKINSSEKDSRRISKSYYQLGVNNGKVANGYLEGILDGTYSFLRYDTELKWGVFTKTKLIELVKGSRRMQDQIDSIPDFKKLWLKINKDIASGNYYYTKKERQYLKGYLAVSAVIEEDYHKLNNSRVIEKWKKFHNNRQLIKKDFLGNSKIWEYVAKVKKIQNGNLSKKIEREGYYYMFKSKHICSSKTVKLLKEKSLITQKEYNVLIICEPTIKKLYKDALAQHMKNTYGVKGSDQALKDYIVDTFSLFNPAEFIELVKGLDDISYDKLTQEYKDLVELYKNREEIFAKVSSQDKAYYEGYIQTTLSLAIVPVKFNKANKLKPKKETEVYKKMIVLLNDWKVKKLVEKFKDINGIDDLLKVARANRLEVKDLKGGAIIIHGDMDGAKGIVEILKKKGWVDGKVENVKGKGTIMNYISKDGKEGLTLRSFGSSDNSIKNSGYEIGATIDILKFKNGKLKKRNGDGNELKFVFPNNTN